MGRYSQTMFVIVSFTLASSCKELQQGSKKSAPIFQAPPAAATSGNQERAPTDPANAAKTSEPALAKLAGYPDTKSPNSQYDISVTGVAEYKWKMVDALTECQQSSGYSNYAPANTPIKLDLASRKDSPAIVALCVIGKNAAGDEQDYATMASWVWTPELPSMSNTIDMIEGNNEIKITPQAPTGNWLVLRSREPLSALPEDGKEYAANQPLGNGTIMVAGPMAEFIDKSVKNEESWNYT
ncbi:MAG: hypothetical protein M3Q07_14750, partial [Pseudobdellovibrionaceae bacterium]|nr:hypothetical protein [Pseudobdellovibrionaceae bacterium]